MAEREYSDENIQVDVSITSFMLAVATFFTGFLISNYGSYDRSIRIPILFLIISTFAFLFTSNIFGNASGEIISGNKKGALRHAAIGTIISEFLGIYLLVLSIPFVINALTDDVFLRVAVFIIAATSIFLYNLSEFSIVKRYLGKWPRIGYAAILIFLETLAFIAQSAHDSVFLYSGVSILIFLFSTTIILGRKKSHYNLEIR